MPRKNIIPVITMSGAAGKRYLRTVTTSRQSRDATVVATAASILDDIRTDGDKALFSYTKKFDRVTLSQKNVRLNLEYIGQRANCAPKELKRALREAAKRIKTYHQHQGLSSFSIKTDEGKLEQRVLPLRRVGVYIPGGHTVYPSSVLMNCIPAKIAGVEQIVAVTPVAEELNPGIAYALQMLGINEVYRIGGAQAIGALAYGTKSITPVDKIVGPGNAYVQTAKKLVYGTVDIDSIAGPSEVVIIIDNSADPELVATDLLAQAEHGSGDEFAICITEDKAMAERVAVATAAAIAESPVRTTLEALPKHAIAILVTDSREQSIALSNTIAPEHLQIITKQARKDLKSITAAAAVFLGPNTPVALGDYFIGTNHVLPTGGAARFASPLGVESFLKRFSVAEINRRGISLAMPHVSAVARTERFIHHAQSVEKRV